MEPATRFDLEAAIQTWRAHLSEELAGQADALAELEEHLRTSVADLRQTGLSDEESLLIAQRRLGSAPKLGAEFRQNNPASVWRRRVFWMALGVLGIQVWGAVANPLGAWLSWSLHDRGDLPRHTAAPTYVAYAVLSTIPLVFAVLMARGALAPRLEFVNRIFANRLRTALLLGLGLTALVVAGQIASLAIIAPQGFAEWPVAVVPGLVMASSTTSLAVLIAWLMPSQKPVVQTHKQF